jgi:uncharacterized integral membrane protein
MQLRNVILLVVLAAVAVFAALNWSVIVAPTSLSLGFAQVQAPLGLVLLGMLAVLSALFLLYLVYLQTTVLLETRRHARELQAQRELADQAEASRFTELRTLLEARLDQLERELRGAIEQSGNSLSAYVGELGDRLDKDRPPQ